MFHGAHFLFLILWSYCTAWVFVNYQKVYHRPASYLKMSSGIGRYFCCLLFVFCLDRVTGLSHPHFYYLEYQLISLKEKMFQLVVI